MSNPKRLKCINCSRPKSNCYCHTLARIRIDSKILIIKHEDEVNHPFNTANMAKLQCEQVELINSNDIDIQNVITNFIEKESPFLLFKNSNSQALTSNTNQKNRSFIVLDGTWDKAKALYFKFKILQALPIYHLDLDDTTESLYYPIRKSPIPQGLSTIEAITKCLGNLYKKNFDEMLEPLKFTVKEQEKYGPKI